jgi:hypothetical protein
MIKRIIFLMLFLGIVSFKSFAQARIEFQVSEHDFGNISEGTIATYHFTFINKGTEPLLINNVQASCGCTTPYWTKEPVMPGKEGRITASYDSKNRPGAFNKSISVTSNAQNSNVTLFIKGVVITKENIEKVFTDVEITESPKIQIDKNEIQLGKVEKGQTVPFSVEVKNSGKTDLEVSQVRAPCNCIKIDGNTKIIKSGKSEIIVLIFTANTSGLKNESVTLYTNDIINPESKISVVAEVVDSLSKKSILKENPSTLSF